MNMNNYCSWVERNERKIFWFVVILTIIWVSSVIYAMWPVIS